MRAEVEALDENNGDDEDGGKLREKEFPSDIKAHISGFKLRSATCVRTPIFHDPRLSHSSSTVHDVRECL